MKMFVGQHGSVSYEGEERGHLWIFINTLTVVKVMSRKKTVRNMSVLKLWQYTVYSTGTGIFPS